jgi:hypothetical protein
MGKLTASGEEERGAQSWRNVRVAVIAAEANQAPEGSTSVNSRISAAQISDSVKRWTTSVA